jgi:PAS domain S-box-containing protein
MLARVGKRIPVYCIFPDICVDHGGIGGARPDDGHAIAAALAVRVLSGVRPDDIPVVLDNGYQLQVDWRQLRFWHIPESALPPGSLVLFRQPTVWERDRKYFVPAIGLILAQALLIAGLLWQRARKRKTEAVLRESEQRFRVMADSTPALIWMCDEQGRITYLNERRVAFTGPDPNAGYGDTWIGYVHPDDQKNVLDSVSQALKTRQPFSKEYRLRRSDGVYRWMLDVATPRVNGDGSFAGFIGSAIDNTDQKLAQEALEKVSGRMIEAQEKERSRIARDLHDDICQRLALLSMEIDHAKRVSGDSSEVTRQRLHEIRKHCSEITGDVQSLSHQLHSSKLDSLGIEAAIRGFCREFSKQHDLNVDFTCRSVPRHLPKEISLCLFRVTQEGLQNAMKYSGVSEFTVELLTLQDEIHLVVADDGAGFDVEEAKRKQGLGLMSMQERVHLVHGVLSIESKPGRGTQVLAVVPVDGQLLGDEEVKDTADLEPQFFEAATILRPDDHAIRRRSSRKFLS